MLPKIEKKERKVMNRNERTWTQMKGQKKAGRTKRTPTPIKQADKTEVSRRTPATICAFLCPFRTAIIPKRAPSITTSNPLVMEAKFCNERNNKLKKDELTTVAEVLVFGKADLFQFGANISDGQVLNWRTSSAHPPLANKSITNDSWSGVFVYKQTTFHRPSDVKVEKGKVVFITAVTQEDWSQTSSKCSFVIEEDSLSLLTRISWTTTASCSPSICCLARWTGQMEAEYTTAINSRAMFGKRTTDGW